MVSWWVRTSSTIDPASRLTPKPTPALSTLVVAMYDPSRKCRPLAHSCPRPREKKDLCRQSVLSAAGLGRSKLPTCSARLTAGTGRCGKEICDIRVVPSSIRGHELRSVANRVAPGESMAQVVL
jgi:hypothetical protein